MATPKTDRQRSAAPPRGGRATSDPIAQAQAAATAARARARAKPTDEQLQRLGAMRDRLRRAEISQAGLETLAAIAEAPGTRAPLLEGPGRAPHAEALAALRAVDEIGRRADPLHCWAPFDEVADRLAEELADRWRHELAAALGGDADEQRLAEFVESRRPELRQRARVQLHELAEWPSETSPEGRLVEVHRQRAAAWFGDEPPPGALVVRLTREGREALERLEAAAAPPRFEGADDLQLVRLCACLAAVPVGDRLKTADLLEAMPQRWPTKFTRGSIAGAIKRGRALGYIPPAENRRDGATLTQRGREFAAANPCES